MYPLLLQNMEIMGCNGSNFANTCSLFGSNGVVMNPSLQQTVAVMEFMEVTNDVNDVTCSNEQ
jgi:hypothetical protein